MHGFMFPLYLSVSKLLLIKKFYYNFVFPIEIKLMVEQCNEHIRKYRLKTLVIGCGGHYLKRNVDRPMHT